MALTRKIQAGLTQAEFTTYVGSPGILFYDNTTGEMRISDGKTPGGLPVHENEYAFAALTGDVTTQAGNTQTTLSTVNSNVGVFGATDSVPIITVDAKGRVTSVSTAAISATITAQNIDAGEY